VKYNAPGAKMELWPISGDYSRVYDTLAFMIRRQILWHKKTCEILRTHKFMIEQVREAYVQYVELLDMPNPVIECYLYNGGPRLFEIRRTGVQFAHPERGTKTITRLADLPEGEMKDIVRIMRDGSRHGIEIFRTPGAYFISDGTERHPKRGHVYSPKFPCGEPA
jgi:hypothetical protein